MRNKEKRKRKAPRNAIPSVRTCNPRESCRGSRGRRRRRLSISLTRATNGVRESAHLAPETRRRGTQQPPYEEGREENARTGGWAMWRWRQMREEENEREREKGGERIIKNRENRRTVSRVAVRATTKLDYFSQLLSCLL